MKYRTRKDDATPAGPGVLQITRSCDGGQRVSAPRAYAEEVVDRSRLLQAVPQLILLPLLFYAGARLSLALAILPELVMLWLPNGILLAGLLHYGTRRYGAFAVMILLAEIAADYPTFSILQATLFGLINLLEVTIAYALLRRWRFDPRFSTPADMARFVFAGPIIAACVAACGGAAVNGGLRSEGIALQELIRVWWFSDGLGLLIVTPLVLSAWSPLPRDREPPVSLRWYDFVAAALTLAVGLAFALGQDRMFHGVTIRPFLLIPPALYAAARLSLRVTTVVVAAITTLVLFVTRNGQQPFGDIPLRETVISVQELIFVMSTMALGIAALLAQHRRRESDLESRVVERTADLNVANARLLEMATTDALTGALNRRAMFDLLQREIDRDRRYTHTLSLIVFDVDHFKQVNDRHGHAAGDAVLRHVAELARAAIRSSDSLARYGGEEFVVIATETSEEQASHLAERIRLALRSHDIPVDGSSLRLTASFGIAALRPADDDAEHVLRRADRALYAAKAAGRDRVERAAIAGCVTR